MSSAVGVAVASMRRSTIACYAVALGVALAVSLLKLNVGWLGRNAPESMFFAVVMFAAWFGGRGPGLLATGVACLTGMYIAPPHGGFEVASRGDAARLAIAAVEGTIIALLGGALRTRNARLQRELAERARAEAALVRATEQLHHAQKMQAFGEFAGGVAHDFNNMLTVVVGSATALDLRLGRDHPAREELATIHEASARATALTRKLLTFARRHPTQREVVDLHEIVERIEPIVRRVVGKSIELELSLTARHRRVSADGAELEQAIVNLAANARDAMPDGGSLKISTADRLDGSPSTPANHVGPQVELTVRDTGLGMDEATKARALEPFFTTKPAGQGTGLGLSVVFGIVQGMGGTVSIESAPGDGTTVRLRLPVAP